MGCVCGMKADGRLGDLQHLALVMGWELPRALKSLVHPLLPYKLGSEKAELLNLDFLEIKPDSAHNRLQKTCLLQLEKLNRPSFAEGKLFLRAGAYDVESRISAGLAEGFC